MRTMRFIGAVVLMAAITLTAEAQGRRGGGGFSRPSGERSVSAPSNLTKPDGSHLSATQQQNVSKLKSDLQAIKQGSQVTQAQKDALKNDLMAMADGATKPDQALVQSLANDLSTALSDGKLSSKEKAQLTQDLEAVMNSANIPMSEVQTAITDAQAILTASGVTQTEVQAVVGDLKAIATEAKTNAQNAAGQLQQKAQGLKGRFQRNQ